MPLPYAGKALGRNGWARPCHGQGWGVSWKFLFSSPQSAAYIDTRHTRGRMAPCLKAG